MISASQIRYASRVPCHGRSCRPCARCHADRRVANERAGAGRRRRRTLRQAAEDGCAARSRRSAATSRAGGRSADREALPRLDRGLGLRVLRDQLLERAPRRRAVAQLELAGGDVEQRVRHFRIAGKCGDELPLRGDRRAIVLQRELRIADPVIGRRRERALAVVLDEGIEARDGRGVVAGLELIERDVVGALLDCRRVGGAGAGRSGPWIPARRLAPGARPPPDLARVARSPPGRAQARRRPRGARSRRDRLRAAAAASRDRCRDRAGASAAGPARGSAPRSGRAAWRCRISAARPG